MGPQGVHARVRQSDLQSGGGRWVAALRRHQIFAKQTERLGWQCPRKGARQGANGELHGSPPTVDGWVNAQVAPDILSGATLARHSRLFSPQDQRKEQSRGNAHPCRAGV